MKWIQSSMLLVCVFALSGCPQFDPNNNGGNNGGNGGNNGGDFECFVEVDNETVTADESIEFTVSAINGRRPYRVSGTPGMFLVSKKVNRTFTNDTNATIVVEEEFTVLDRDDEITVCTIELEVEPADTGDDDSDDDSDDDTSDDDTSDDTVATIDVTIEPDNIVQVGQSIIVSAITDGFEEAITYTFEFSHSGVQLGQDVNIGTFTVTDGQAHAFSVTVRAKSDTEEAISVIYLAFLPASPITCEIEFEELDLVKDNDISFKIVSAESSSLEITHFKQGNDIGYYDIGSFSGDTATAQFSSAGYKNILIKAKDSVTGAECHVGETILIRKPLTCEAQTYWYPENGGTGTWSHDILGYYYTVENIWAYASVPSNSGYGDISITGVKANGSAKSFTLHTQDARAAKVKFSSPGYYYLTLTIEDESGATSSCNTGYLPVYTYYNY